MQMHDLLPHGPSQSKMTSIPSQLLIVHPRLNLYLTPTAKIVQVEVDGEVSVRLKHWRVTGALS